WKRNRIMTGVARGAVGTAPWADRREHPVEAQIPQAVRFDELADLLERVRGADELGPLRRVDAVEARGNRRRAADTHVHLPRAGRPHDLDDLPACRAAHDGVVHEDHTLARENAFHWIEFHGNANVA